MNKLRLKIKSLNNETILCTTIYGTLAKELGSKYTEKKMCWFQFAVKGT